MTTVCGTGRHTFLRAKTNFNFIISFTSSMLIFQDSLLSRKKVVLIKSHIYIVMAKFPIPENCSAYVPMILKEFCSSKINGLVMKTFSGK
jgi:hypothetical protein